MTELKFRIVNSQIGERQVEIEHDGEPAIVTQRKLYVDAEPLSGTVKTLELVLPADHADAFPEGAVITATLSVEAPLALSDPAPADDQPALEA